MNPDTRRDRRRARLGLMLAGVVVIAGGFAIGVVEMLRWPKGSVWVVVGVTVAIAALIRALTSPRG
jgi:hypothetical protein